MKFDFFIFIGTIKKLLKEIPYHFIKNDNISHIALQYWHFRSTLLFVMSLFYHCGILNESKWSFANDFQNGVTHYRVRGKLQPKF